MTIVAIQAVAAVERAQGELPLVRIAMARHAVVRLPARIPLSEWRPVSATLSSIRVVAAHAGDFVMRDIEWKTGPGVERWLDGCLGAEKRAVCGGVTVLTNSVRNFIPVLCDGEQERFPVR